MGEPSHDDLLPPPELARFRNATIGFVFQFHHLLPEFSAVENAMMPALIGRVPTREARSRAEAPEGYTLVGCTVSPAFRFEGFELAPDRFEDGG